MGVRMIVGRPKLLLSFPRSGTDWFCGIVSESPELYYYREYFNPICNSERAGILRERFGDETFESYHNIMADWTLDELAPVVENTWTADPFNMTKENYLAIKAEHFVERCDTVCLIRNMSHTFPTSNPDYIIPILSSFMASGGYKHSFLANQLNELRSLYSFIPVASMHEAGILAYIVHHYLLLAVCRKFVVPIIRYEDLMLQTQARLETKLRCVERFGVDVSRLTQRLIETRASDPEETLARRRHGFWSLPKVSWLDRVIRFLADLSPELKTDFELYLEPAPAGEGSPQREMAPLRVVPSPRMSATV